MKSSYIVRATNFLHQIYPLISRALDNPRRIGLIIEDYNRIHKRAVIFKRGATRLVLITSDYVIKWNYSDRVKRFGGCVEEAAMYQIARYEGYDYLLAEATLITYNDATFLIMPRFDIKMNKPDLCDLINNEEYLWLNDHIDDLHDNNFTVVNGRPIIIDYACGHSDTSESSSY